MQAVFRWIAVVTLAVALTPWTTHAQTIQCVAPTISATCTYSLDLPDSIRIRVVDAWGDPMPGTVTFLGAPAVPQVRPTDRYGEVATQVRGSGSVDLTVEFSQVGQPSVSRVVQIRPPTPPTQSQGTITIDRGADQHWYAGRQLKDPVSITLDTSTCSNLTQPVAVFRSTGDGAHLSPDTVPLQNCSAETWWTLGDEVGTQHLAVSVPGSGRRVIARAQTSATARQGARLIFGLAVGWEQSFKAYVPKDSATVTTIRVDSVTTHTTVKTEVGSPGSRKIDGRVQFRPTIGVDWAPFPSQERLRFSIAAAVQDLDRYFYVGASVLSWREGIHHDPDPFSIHLFFQAARLEVAEEECGNDVTFCAGDDFELFNGGGLMVTIDPANMFTGLASILFR